VSAARHAGVARGDRDRTRVEARGFQRRADTLEPVRRVDVPGGRRERPDPSVAERHEVLGREPPARAVVGRDRRVPDAGRRAVDEHDGEGRGVEPLPVVNAETARSDDDTVDAPVDEQFEVGALAVGVVRGIAQEDRVAVVARRVLDGPHELREERVLDVGDDQAVCSRRPELE
jgi:hypothetical protein